MASKDLTTFMKGADLPAVSEADMAAALGDTIERPVDGETSGVRRTYLSFSGKSGVYQLGQKKEDVDPETVFLMEPQSVTEGWICWKGGKPVGRIQWSVYKRDQHAVSEDDLEDHGPYNTNAGDGWASTRGFGFLDLEDPELPSISFSTSSVSGRNSVSDLLEEVRKRILSGEPSMPLIGFDKERFEAQGQTNYKPTFPVEAWVTRDAAAAFLNGEMELDDLIDGKAPKKKATRKKKAA